MYEHPYYTYRVTALEQERAAMQAERRRMAVENADRIRTRPGVVAQLLGVAGRRRAVRPGARAVTVAHCPAGQDCAALAR